MLIPHPQISPCLLYTSDAADESSRVDLGGRRIIKKKTGAAPQQGTGGQYRQRFRRAGDAVRGCLLRLESGRACTQRCAASGTGTVWRAGDGSSAGRHCLEFCEERQPRGRAVDQRAVALVADP